MTIRLTRGAEDYLRAYLADVRSALARSTGVDATEVEAGIREHVDAELAARAAGRADSPATMEDVADVIESLGPPEAWSAGGADEGVLGGVGVGNASEEPTATRRGVLTAAFAAIVVGVGLAFTPRWAGLGWLLVIGGSLALRVVAPVAVDSPSGALERLAAGWWAVFTVAAGLVLLLAPAVLAWGAAQIGGVLEEPLAAHLGAQGGSRPPGYWLATAAVAAFATGVWWIIVGVIVRRFGDPIRRALGTARGVARPATSRVLVRAGAILLVASLAGLLL